MSSFTCKNLYNWPQESATLTLTYGEMQRDSVFDFFRNQIAHDLNLYPFEWDKVRSKYANRKSAQAPMTSYVTAVEMIALYVTISKIFAIDMSMTLTLALKSDQGKITNQKQISDFLFHSNFNAWLICYRLRDIYDRNTYDLDLISQC